MSAVVLAGGILTSYHQPFRAADGKLLELAQVSSPGRWHAVHLLAGGCGCSQRVMTHLLERGVAAGVTEEVVVVDGPEPYLAGSATLLEQLKTRGFNVSHRAVAEIAPEMGLRGVPLLLVADPDRKVRYMGGYGSRGDQAGPILTALEQGREVRVEALIGCAVGSQLRHKADPFALKY
jgi:hypothetical protein